MLKFTINLTYRVVQSAESGAQITLKLAMSKKYKDMTGQFVWDFLASYPSPKILSDKKFSHETWKETEKWVQLQEHERL